MKQLIDRMMGAARLDSAIYEQIESDEEATDQAAIVVLMSAVAAGVGSLGVGGLGGLIGGTIAGLVGWVLWAAVIYLIGAKILPGRNTDVDIGQLLRTLGFAQAPGVLRIFGFIPLLGGLIHVLVSVWLVVTMVVAVRQALDYETTGRAVAVVGLGFLVYLLVFGVFYSFVRIAA